MQPDRPVIGPEDVALVIGDDDAPGHAGLQRIGRGGDGLAGQPAHHLADLKGVGEMRLERVEEAERPALEP